MHSRNPTRDLFLFIEYKNQLQKQVDVFTLRASPLH